MQSAKLNDLGTIARLKVEQTHICSSLQNKNETMGVKTRRLALIIEERMKLADESLIEEGIFAYAIEQISTEIGRLFDRLRIPSDHVKNYLVGDDPNGRPYSRFKDPSQQRNVTGDRGSGGREIDQLIGLVTKERELKTQLKTMATSDMDTVYSNLKNFFKSMETEADERHHTLPGHEKKEEVRTRKNDPRFTKLSEAWKWYREGPCLAMEEFTYNNPPPPEVEEKYAMGVYTMGNMYYSITNKKKSLTVWQWLSRIKYMFGQSKHGAAVEDEIMTHVCSNCWDEKAGRDREGCNSEMDWDWSSPTNWRCRTCGGTLGEWRGLTREQCGDNKSPIITVAQNLAYNLPGVYEMMIYYVEGGMVDIYSRKVRLGPKLSAEA